MASGDSDHIEMMESAVAKKSDVAGGPSGSEDDGGLPQI